MSNSLPYVLGSGGICPDYEEEQLDLGSCCACGENAPNTRNIITLEKLASVPGTGWGCFVCNLPSDGAMAVMCDACLEAKAEIREVIHGFAAQKQRIPINALKPGVFKHTTELHEREG